MIVYNNFEWDVSQAAAGLATHGVSFKEASTVFAADDVTISEDPASGHLRAVGLSARGRVLSVLHQRGPRIRILGATLHNHRAASAAPRRTAAKPVAPEPAAAAPADTEAAVESAPPDSRPPGSDWTAEAYGIYWEAYSAARQAARQQGKSPREAQRLGREAGERAAFGHVAPASSKRSPRSGPGQPPLAT